MTKQSNNDFQRDLTLLKDLYQRQGWWTGERLQDRYASIVSERSDDLAVADNRGRRLTHSELWSASGTLAEGLAKQGVRPGAVVILFLPNWVEWQLALLGILRSGCIPATLPTRIDSDNLHYVAALTGARGIITTERPSSTATGEIARLAAQLCDCLLYTSDAADE